MSTTSSSPPQTLHHTPPPAPPSGSRPPPTSTSSTRRPHESRLDAFPFSMTRPFRANPSSTSVAPSTAEGRAIPVDDTTAEHRTSALRELNNHYPSRHRYAKSTGAQSSTYSEPVIVRSYYSPSPNSRQDRSAARRRPGRCVSGSDAGGGGGPASNASRGLPFRNKIVSTGNGMLSSMARVYSNKKMAPTASLSAQQQTDAKLPPVEAFSFKSFMANMETQSATAGGGISGFGSAAAAEINSDLDRIAEICARSRYSLSNQYEVHYAPHGSGVSFLQGANNHEQQGPTLQAVTSDDERDMRSHTTSARRRQAVRRNSRAMGTLETIMSSSRSSDEDKTKKKSASELATEVRGRTTKQTSGHSSPTTSSRSRHDESNSQDGEEAAASAPPPRTPVRRLSTSLALIDGSRQGSTPVDASTPRSSATALVGEPALPKASSSQLVTRTGTGDTSAANTKPIAPTEANAKDENRGDKLHGLMARGSISSVGHKDASDAGFLTTLSGWLPWTATASPATKGRAEGSLRDLLKHAEVKGKSTEAL